MIAPKDNPLFQADTPISSGKMESNLAEDPILPTSTTHLVSEVEDFKNSKDDDLFADSESLLEEDELFTGEDNPVTDSTQAQTNLAEEQLLSPPSWGSTLQSNPDTWRILIVDDEKDVHEITHLVLDDYVYEGKPVTLFSAYSAQQAKALLQQEPTFAILFLDVVMESNDAGLQLVHYIRETLKDRFTRIILRTGQPGHAPEEDVILKYEINDYANKTELSRTKLLTLTIASLRAYSDLLLLESYRQHLEDQVVKRTQELQQRNAELLQLNQALIKLNQEKNDFLGIAAHDLKNPLSSIQGLADLIQMAFEEGLSTEETIREVIDFSRMISISSQQMYELITNLLDVNAIESGQLKLRLRPLNLAEVVTMIIKSYSVKAKSKDIKLYFQAQERFYPILVDDLAIRQILDNLVSNAIKYSPLSKNITSRLSQDANEVRWEIQDEGPGLSAEEQQRLFHKFCRLTPKPTTEEEHSTGLGLFIVKKLVKAMNGKVWCESQLEQGTKFIVTFPKVSNTYQQ
jgi:signal transduction histidine kinase